MIARNWKENHCISVQWHEFKFSVITAWLSNQTLLLIFYYQSSIFVAPFLILWAINRWYRKSEPTKTSRSFQIPISWEKQGRRDTVKENLSDRDGDSEFWVESLGVLDPSSLPSPLLPNKTQSMSTQAELSTAAALLWL